MVQALNSSEGSLWPELVNFSIKYTKVHGHLSLVISILGIVANCLNVIVLSQPNMRTPTNCILSGLAVADSLTMMCYVPFAFHFYIHYTAGFAPSPEKNSKIWMNFLLFHGNFTATTHTVSIWMGVLLAVFRYRHIQSPAKGHLTRIRRLVRARLMVVLVYVFSVVILIPNYMSYKLISRTFDNITWYEINSLNIGTSHVAGIMHANLWIYSIFAKLMPCIIMVVYASKLVATLKRRDINLNRFDYRKTSAYKTVSNSRTTRMLIVVLILFLVTELPQGLILLISILVSRVFDEIYMPLGDVMDITALINNSINFFLYCVMSAQFRQTFVKLFCNRKEEGASTKSGNFTSRYPQKRQSSMLFL